MSTSENNSFANKIYSSYEEAVCLCTDGGYSNLELSNMVIEKNINFRNSINDNSYLIGDVSRTILSIAFAFNSNSLRVLDFGGGGGYHYTLAKHILKDKCDIKWNIVETNSMCLAAKSISDQNLKFFNDIKSAVSDLGYIDLILASSSIQYCSDPLSVLNDILNINSKHIYITRTPFFSGQNKLVSIQKSLLSNNGPGKLPLGYMDKEIMYPISYLPINKVEQLIEEKYNIRFKIIEEEANLFIDNFPVNSHYGLFCDLK